MTFFYYKKIENSVTFIFFLIFLFLTDFFDGYIARKYNQETEIGMHLDPIADKISFLSSLLPLSYQGIIPLPIVFGFLLRDSLVSSLRQISKNKNVLSPSTYGKIKTALIMFLSISSYTSFNFITSNIIKFFWIITLFLSWKSAISYLYSALEQ